MGKSDHWSKKLKNSSATNKYSTEYIVREKHHFPSWIKTTPKYELRSLNESPINHFEYLKNNLHIKTCIWGNKQVLEFQVKKISFREYTPKILDQEINMGMWI